MRSLSCGGKRRKAAWARRPTERRRSPALLVDLSEGLPKRDELVTGGLGLIIGADRVQFLDLFEETLIPGELHSAAGERIGAQRAKPVEHTGDDRGWKPAQVTLD